jgi:hypothetical protein
VQNGDIVFTGFALGGSAAGNYALTPPTVAASITSKNITVGGSITATKTYDGNGGFTATDIDITAATLPSNLDGPDLTLDKSGATGSFAMANVQSGGIAFTGFALDGTAKGNYTLTAQPTVAAGITPIDITVSGGAVTTKDYNGTATATVTGLTFTGPLTDDEPFTSPGNYTVSASYTDSPNAGTGKPVTATVTLQGITATNYNLINGSPYTLTGNVDRIMPTPAGLDVTLSDVAYDGLAHPVTVTPGVEGLGAITVYLQRQHGPAGRRRRVCRHGQYRRRRFELPRRHRSAARQLYGNRCPANARRI